MLCTKCGETVKPVAALDIDGTLGDYHSHFLTFAELWVGQPFHVSAPQFDGLHWPLGDSEATERDSPTPFRDYVSEQLGIEHAEWRQIKLAYRQGGMKRSMPIFPGAVELCQDVREAGAELWLTTTRPYLRLDNVDPDTRAWLVRHNIEYDGLLYDEEKYRRLAESVQEGRVVFVLDDLLEQVEAARDAFGATVPHMACGPYNRGSRDLWTGRAVSGLEDARDVALRTITNWRMERG